MKALVQPAAIGGLPVLFLAACLGSEERTSKGPNSSETENALSARILLADGTPAAGAWVSVFDTSSWMQNLGQGRELAQRRLVADSQGRISIDLSDNRSRRILVTTGTEGVVFHAEPGRDPRTWSTAALGSLRVRPLGAVPTGSRMCLFGTDQCADKDAQGVFAFPGLPAASYQPVLHSRTSGQTVRFEGVALPSTPDPDVDSVLVLSDSLVLEDFEDGDLRGRLADWNFPAKWWIYTSAATSNPAGEASFPSRLVADSPRPGKILHLTTSGMDSATGSLVLAGLNFGAGSNAPDSARVFADLSGMRALRFRIRGTGKVTILLQTRATLGLGDEKHLHRIVTLDGSWQDVQLRPADFSPIPGSLAEKAGLRFSDVAERTSAVVFQFTTNGDYALDDIRILGTKVLHLEDWSD